MNIGLHSWMHRKMAEVSEEALETRAVGWITIWYFDSLQRRCRGFDSIGKQIIVSSLVKIGGHCSGEDLRKF